MSSVASLIDFHPSWDTSAIMVMNGKFYPFSPPKDINSRFFQGSLYFPTKGNYVPNSAIRSFLIHKPFIVRTAFKSGFKAASSLDTIPWMTIQDTLCQGFTDEFPPPDLSTFKVGSKEKCRDCGYCMVYERQCQNLPWSFKVSFLTSILVPLNLSPEIFLPPTS